MSTDHKGYIGVYAFAREMGWTVDWVYKQIQAGKIPAEKRGRKWQIKRSVLEAAMAGRQA
jgi:excisionase family DNA binding protein